MTNAQQPASAGKLLIAREDARKPTVFHRNTLAYGVTFTIEI
jgi:hypothetical protein